MADQVTMFHLVLVVLDPYTIESSVLLKTAGRILEEFAGADCRAGWLITADEADTSAFLGPWEKKFLTFCDPERKAVQALGIEGLPALIHIGGDLTIIGKAEGWERAPYWLGDRWWCLYGYGRQLRCVPPHA